MDVFIGEIRLLAFNYPPIGWVPCDGRLLSISEYTPLYSLIGTLYGGNGQTTFGVPDLRGRVPVHTGGTATAGTRGGTEQVTLLPTHLPPHTHSALASVATASSASPQGAIPASAVGQTRFASDLTGATAIAMSPSSVSYQGGGQPHDNMMPTMPLYFCMATAGIYPSQA